MSRRFEPVAADELAATLAARLNAIAAPGHALRVAVDGPGCTDPTAFAGALIAPLRELGRPADIIAAELFLRDASLRLEYGREDVDAFLDWLDADALRREVLEPLGPAGSGAYLPSLRDPLTNRATRAAVRPAAAGAIVIIAGELLLGTDLPFDVTVHLSVSAASRRRRTPPDRLWTLEAFDRYDVQVRPIETADVVVSLNDPLRPAVG